MSKRMNKSNNHNKRIYKSTTHKTKLYLNLLFWESCIYKRWTHNLLPSQHSCANSAAEHHVHIDRSLPSITSLIAVVRLNLMMGKGHRGCPCRRAQRGWGRPWWCPPSHTTLKQEQENICGIIWLSLGLLQTSLCLLSMNTTTCKKN